MTLAAPLFSFGFNGYVSIWNVYEHIYKMNKAKMIKFWKVTPEDRTWNMGAKNHAPDVVVVPGGTSAGSAPGA